VLVRNEPGAFGVRASIHTEKRRTGVRQFRICGLVLSVLTRSSPCFAQTGQDALIAEEKEAWKTFKTKQADAFASLLGKDRVGEKCELVGEDSNTSRGRLFFWPSAQLYKAKPHKH
jgi:hypothetical protein